MAGSSFKFGKVRQSKNDITSAAGTTVLTNASDHYQYVTGATTQTVQLPDATTMALGVGFCINNTNSTGNVTVVDNGSNVLTVLTPGSSTEFVCDSISTTNGVWMQSNGAGGGGLSVNNISANTNLTAGSINLVDTSSTAITLTLPAPTNGTTIYVEDKGGNAAANTITINQHASDTIDGVASYYISINYGSVRITSDGTNWYVLGEIASAFIVATGGTITTSGNRKIHTFTTSGTFTVQKAPSGTTVDSLVVAGGGGGGGGSLSGGGGGGAGGLIYTTGSSISTGAFSVVIGAGALGSGFTNSGGVQGSSSSFNGISPIGGGSSQGNGNGIAGGSGAGGGETGAGGAGTGGQGNAGGTGSAGFAGGGGGGAGSVGAAGVSDSGGGGGAGVSNSITGSPVFYAGGGGGGGQTAAGTGGSGGGGNGGQGGSGGPNAGVGFDGTANTGGGGGGGQSPSTGGSGIVIISYQYK